MKNSKIALILMAFVFYSCPAMELPNEGQASLGAMPADIKNLILYELIEVDPSLKPDDLTDFYKSIKNITNYARLNSEFKALVNDPRNMIWLVKTLVERFKDKSPKSVDELFIAKGLANMPGIKSIEFQNWLQNLIKEKELRLAAEDLNVEKVKKLLAEGIDANASDRLFNMRPLNYLVWGLAFKGGNEQNTAEAITILKLLMAAGANINVQAGNGYTPILLATIYQNIPLMQAILEYHPDLSLADSGGGTPFHFAVAAGDSAIMKVLSDYVQKNQIAVSPEIQELMQSRIQ